MSEKPSNPKDAIGTGKLPLHLWPALATAHGSLALLDGMLKYGRSNWRSAGVCSSIYVDAAKRHLDKWFEGQDHDPDSGLSHLAHVLACVAIVLDAQAAGKLNDDRMFNGGGAVDALTSLTPHVARLKALHADKNPHHYTIADEQDFGRARVAAATRILESLPADDILGRLSFEAEIAEVRSEHPEA